METTIELDASNRIVLTRAMREAAGIPRLQKLKVTSHPGRIIFTMSPRTLKFSPPDQKVWGGKLQADSGRCANF